MAQFQFWGGLDTIGGNIVEIRTDQARVICDFGWTGNQEFVQNFRGLSELEYLLLEEKLPAIADLYETTSFQEMELSSFEDSSLHTAVFISHLHLDHMGMLKYLPSSISVYLSEEAYALYKVLVEVREEEPVSLNFFPFRYEERLIIGDITVIPKKSDHDIPGACALFIETADLRLIHSGDLRLTGRSPEAVEQWIQTASEWETDILLLEGTSFSFEEGEKKNVSEKELIRSWQKLLKMEKEQIIFFNPYIRNVERLKKIADETQQNGRIFVFEEAYARVLHAFYPAEKWNILNEPFGEKVAEYTDRFYSLNDLKKSPEKFVLQNSLKNSDYIKFFSKGLYVHSNGEPLGDYDENYQPLIQKLEKHQFQLVELSSSGHASQRDLVEIAKRVKARWVVPWHTFEPQKMNDALKVVGMNVLLPEREKWYNLQREGLL